MHANKVLLPTAGLLSLLAILFMTGSAIRAQTPTNCSYKTTVGIYTESSSGILTPLKVPAESLWGISNDKQLARNPNTPALSFTSETKATFSTVALKLKPDPAADYAQGDKATVTLLTRGLSDTYDITRRFCTSKNKGPGCPNTISNIQQPNDTISGFTIACGVDIDYGWIVTPKKSITTISPKPQKSPTKSPTPLISQPSSSGMVTTSLFIWGDTNDMCFINVDTAKGEYRSQGSHCRVTSCSQKTSSVPSRLVVDYTNNRLPIQNPLLVSVQINKCNGKKIGELEGVTQSECNGYVDRINNQTIPFDKTFRCIWDDPFVVGSKKFRCSLVDPKALSACSDASPTTTPLPTKSPTPTPRKSRPTMTPTKSPTPSKNHPSPTNKPSPTATPSGSWTLSTSELLAHWNFTPHLSFKSFMSFKFGICDTYKDEAYRTTEKDLAAHCRWFNAKPTSATRADHMTGTLKAAKNQTLDYDGKPLEKDKTYYLTCQYYLIKSPVFRTVPRPNTIYDEWRRCRPKPIRKGDIKTFENVLSPQESFVVEERVALSIPGAKRKIAKIGDPVVALTFDLKPLNVGDGTSSIDPKYIQAFRPGICPKAKSPQDHNANNCIFFDPIPLDRDIQDQEDVEIALREGKYYTKLHYVIAQNVQGDTLELGETVGITCQYIYDAPLSPQRVRRCNIKNLKVRQRFHADFFDKFTPDALIAITDDFVLDEGGEGTIPLFQAPSKAPASLNLSLCDEQTGDCTVVDTKSLTSGTPYNLQSISEDTPLLQGHAYKLTCSNDQGNSCGEQAVLAGEPIYIDGLTVSTGRDLCDSNGDGECNTLDLVDCLKKPASLPKQCDMNLDGQVSAEDRSMLLNLAGQESK